MARPGLVGGQYQPLTRQQIERIHQASLAVLENTGVHVENVGALEFYRQGGAKVDGNRVHIPTLMVEEALEKMPSRVLLAGRDPGQDVVLEGRRVYAGTGGSPAMVLGPGVDTVQPATLHDLANFAQLADVLEHCDFIVIPLHPTDVPEEDVPVNLFYACLANITKRIMGGVGSAEGARAVVEMGVLLTGGRDAHAAQRRATERRRAPSIDTARHTSAGRLHSRCGRYAQRRLPGGRDRVWDDAGGSIPSSSLLSGADLWLRWDDRFEITRCPGRIRKDVHVSASSDGGGTTTSCGSCAPSFSTLQSPIVKVGLCGRKRTSRMRAYGLSP